MEILSSSTRPRSKLSQREEKFFSKNVTNVVTTRPIPSGSVEYSSKNVASGSSKTSSSTAATSQVKTINPSILERTGESQAMSQVTRSKHPVDAMTQQRRPQT